jgi:predicted CXXCH cytochrome family protein
VHKPVKEACTNCHTPHASEITTQLKAPTAETCYRCHGNVQKHVAGSKVGHAAMLEQKACANCHDPHASAQPKMLKARADAVCLTCHDKPIKGTDGHTIADMRPSLGGKFLHGPVKAGECSACHDVHGSPNDGLLKQTFPKTFYTSFDVKDYALCFSCHEKELVLTDKTMNLTNFRDGEKNLHFVHVNRDEKGRTCKTCHAVHGSDLPKHMASEVPMGDGRWSMPIGYEQMPDGGRCASGCHKPREYNRNRPTAAATRPIAAAGRGAS